MKIANGARIHASRIKPGMRVMNIVHNPWEFQRTYDVGYVDSVVLEGTTVYAINGTDGSRATNVHGYWLIADVPAEGTVTEFAKVPYGAYVTAIVDGHGRGGQVTGRRAIRCARRPARPTSAAARPYATGAQPLRPT